MNQRILYNFASRSRPDKFQEAVRNITNLGHDTRNYYILAKFDNDDSELRKYLDAPAPSCKIHDVVGDSTSKVHAINRDIPADGFDIIVNMSDDMRFTVPGFDNIIRQHCGPDDFVHFPDGHVNRRLCTMSIIGAKYYKRFGYIYHPSYKSLWCDNEAQEVAKKLRRYKYIRQQIFEHQHHANGFGPKDELLLHTESFHGVDKQNYINRKRRGFPL